MSSKRRLYTKKNKRQASELVDDEYAEDFDYNSNDDDITMVKKSTQSKKYQISDSESDSDSNSNSNSDLQPDSNSNSNSDVKSNKTNTPPNALNSIIKKKTVKNSNEIFKELIKKQLPDVPSQWKLNINDMKRICKYIDTSIFDKNNCCMWNGYITNMNNSNKGTYVNFYFRNKKVALHRLLYSNFVAPLDSSEYLKFNCDNKGICCNINHYEKYKYSKNNNSNIIKKDKKKHEQKKDIKEITIIGSDDPDKLIINFD